VGIAKGSGMIAPHMATMLGFIFTDAAVPAGMAQRCLSAAVSRSFNRITVDSDTSTSDTVLLFATGAVAPGDGAQGAGGPGAGDDTGAESAVDEAAFQAALDAVCLELAHQIVRDGEGATKFVAVTVTGAADDAAAEIIARAIADSPLVKTALAAEDANWGRIVMAVGKAGQEADRDALAIWIGDEHVSTDGAVLATYSEARATEHLRGDEVSIGVDVGIGPGEATVWTCDLTHRYIDINAGYRS
ncbi:MAG: bifunctional ornithine acetyltransferase/N-acetylglutamate synthase, partial [Acidimicrobiia bacterium]|nr:bifunctional ornithine acetyltransferase/N-acetylglutamate synthase [Acidimicrobiia bacterium]